MSQPSAATSSALTRRVEINDVATAYARRSVRLGSGRCAGGSTISGHFGGSRTRRSLNHGIGNQSELLGRQHNARLGRVRIFWLLCPWAGIRSTILLDRNAAQFSTVTDRCCAQFCQRHCQNCDRKTKKRPF